MKVKNGLIIIALGALVIANVFTLPEVIIMGFIVVYFALVALLIAVNFDKNLQFIETPVLLKQTDIVTIREEWKQFYKNHFNWDVDFTNVVIPPMPTNGKWRLLFIPKGMKPSIAFAMCTKLFKTWSYYDDLDDAITENARKTAVNYAVWVRDEVEPDIETLGQSTRKADPDMKFGITLLERIIFEIKYFTETGGHLDIKGITFCSGSRDSGGNVPDVFWGDDRFRVDWRRLVNSYSGYGIRSAVAL